VAVSTLPIPTFKRQPYDVTFALESAKYGRLNIKGGYRMTFILRRLLLADILLALIPA
jgi:hypothetical protein